MVRGWLAVIWAQPKLDGPCSSGLLGAVWQPVVEEDGAGPPAARTCSLAALGAACKLLVACLATLSDPLRLEPPTAAALDVEACCCCC